MSSCWTATADDGDEPAHLYLAAQLRIVTFNLTYCLIET